MFRKIIDFRIVTGCIMAGKLGLPATQKIHEHWSFIDDALASAGLVSWGLTSRFVTPGNSAVSLRLLDVHRLVRADVTKRLRS